MQEILQALVDWAPPPQPRDGGVRIVQAGGAEHPSWSPNGHFITYVQHGELFVHDLRSGNRRSILRGYGHITEPRWMR